LLSIAMRLFFDGSGAEAQAEARRKRRRVERQQHRAEAGLDTSVQPDAEVHRTAPCYAAVYEPIPVLRHL